MSRQNETFFTSIGCMDGRVQEPILKLGQKKFGVQYADAITEAGLVGLLAKKTKKSLLNSIKKKILISIEKHHSKHVVVSGHQDCAGNPVDDEKHKDDIRKSVKVIQSLIKSPVSVTGVFVKRFSNDPTIWEVEEL